MGWMTTVQFSARAILFFSSPPHPDQFSGSLLSNGYQGLYPPGVKQPGHEDDNLPSFCAKVQNTWSDISNTSSWCSA